MSDKLKKIRSGALERAASLAKMSVSGALKAGKFGVSTLLSDSEKRGEIWRKLLLEQAQVLTSEMTRLKGSLLKAGQMLSIVGERILPPEVVEVLRSLQSRALALEWPAIEKELLRELGPERLRALDISTEPIGAASLGQVHAATVRADGRQLALKVKYPGVDSVIDSDLKWLRGILRMSGLIPFSPSLDVVFEEARRMLHQEVDYRRERELTAKFGELLSGDERYVVPRPVPEFSNAGVLATTFEPGIALEDPQVAALSQERRNALGLAFFELYLRELIEFRLVQTDPHFGNYRIRLSDGQDQWVLYDFGATRELDQAFVERYRRLLWSAVQADERATAAALTDLGMLAPGESSERARALVEFCLLATEPTRHGEYDWGASDLPERAAAYIPKIAFRPDVRLPPAEMLSLDRKTGGVFLMLAKLRAKIDIRPLIDRYLSPAK